MTRYSGLDRGLRAVVLARDRHRCRFCGATNRGVDLHHVRYRRGTVDDVAANLVALCRSCHGFVHGEKRQGETITKDEAQELLFALIEMPGATGLALRRQWKRRNDTLGARSDS